MHLSTYSNLNFWITKQVKPYTVFVNASFMLCEKMVGLYPNVPKIL